MGYTHYWSMPKRISPKNWEKSVRDIQKIVDNYRDILAQEYDIPEMEPIVSVTDGIKFNGIGENGHETFLIYPEFTDFNFCKTARKPYDIAVCECLLVLKANIEGFTLSSDGFYHSGNDLIFDGSWEQAIKNVKALDYYYDKSNLELVVSS